jgi:tRNA threonylcarbamoyladenosine biosynthesis protein TsaB
MSWILNIDTSLETAFVSIAKEGKIIAGRSNADQKDHASFLEPAVQSLLKDSGIQLSNLSAIAVVSGPGSYTGLRVGMSSAKGLCYALNKPLILLNNLELLSIAAINEFKITQAKTFFCPMIDARRMEVFTAVYDQHLNLIEPPHSLILQPFSFNHLLEENVMVFFGNGAVKWNSLCDDKNARFVNINDKNAVASQSSFQRLAIQSFTSVAYAEPLYIKEFYSTQGPS